jgi:hypothetical protein
MKLSRLAFAAAIAWGIHAGSAQAQQRMPTAAPAAYDYGYYYQPEQPSPSDQPAPPVAPAMAPIGVPGHSACAPVCEDFCEDDCVCEPWRLFCQDDCGWNVYGWVNGGIMANTDSPADNYNGPVTFADRDWGQLNQLYGIVEKKANNCGCGWGFGGRVDVLWGSDYVFTQATGLELHDDATPHWNIRSSDGSNPEYGLALPQAYLQAQYNDWDIKLGHFYTVLGYEVVPAPGNFFYTHSYTMQYGEPFTHTGVLGTYKYSDTTGINLGFVNGSDHFDREVDTGAGIVGFNWDGGNGLTVGWNIFFSPNEFINSGPNATAITGDLSNRTVYSLVVGQTFGYCDQWQYVFQHDMGWQNDASAFVAGDTAEWYGINQYLFYTMNDCWKAGFRLEWFRDDDGARVTGLRNPTNAIFGDFFAGDFYEFSAGLNWTPSANLTVRPELRYDWFDGVAAPGNTSALPYDNGTAADQFLVGLDVIYLW